MRDRNQEQPSRLDFLGEIPFEERDPNAMTDADAFIIRAFLADQIAAITGPALKLAKSCLTKTLNLYAERAVRALGLDEDEILAKTESTSDDEEAEMKKFLRELVISWLEALRQATQKGEQVELLNNLWPAEGSLNKDLRTAFTPEDIAQLMHAIAENLDTETRDQIDLPFGMEIVKDEKSGKFFARLKKKA